MAGSIYGFFGNNRWLSNFQKVNVTLPGDSIIYPSTEHAYQAAKTFDMNARKAISEMKKPQEAKEMGKILTLRPDWEDVKLVVMEQLLRQKYTNDPMLKAKLLETGDEYLEETNWWDDKFWGVCDGDGENHLGKITMKIRDELRKEEPQCLAVQ